MCYDIKKIRNFSIIAHIDHGKSTISDRIIQICGGLEEREMQEQVLDSLDIEKERGITIKSQAVRLEYVDTTGTEYVINLMDTPGHVDFGYEVSRCLAACEGAVLVVDTTQGVQAQTLANCYKAIEVNNHILLALNKIDLQSSDVKKTSEQIESIIGLDASNPALVSGKTGQGIENLLEEIIKTIPHPNGDINKPTKALLIDAWYDIYLGIVLLVRVIDGSLERGSKIKMKSNNSIYEVDNIGYFTPKKKSKEKLFAGEVGYITANIKKISDCNIGDTIVLEADNKTEALPGFKKIKPSVFCGIYPVEQEDYLKLKEAIERLALNDSSIFYETESSNALGLGFRCGFLGLLHLDVVFERLTEEFEVDLVSTAPSVTYNIHLRDGTVMQIDNSSLMPDLTHVNFIEEPIVKVSIITPEEYLGTIIRLCIEKRGVQKDLQYSTDSVFINFEIPLSEIIFDFHDRLKSMSKGYASFEWEFLRYEKSDIVKVDILLKGERVEALSFFSHISKAENRGRSLCLKLKEEIPRHMFAVPIQAAIGGKIIARETISALSKDVTAKCYGGDMTRKRKLLEKQKRGKKKMKAIGTVQVPPEAFLSILRTEND